MENKSNHHNKNAKDGARDSQKGTFIVKVEFCQNNTWQGKITWAEENQSQRFRSALELLNLIDGAMAKTKEKASEEGNQEHSVS
ncbi:hypothetical protein [Butyrivibrio sp. YAB3001]|uniref:hypothetical protein n=1 Tax=Butyrivibrio sp. YAB3001 TaxID=1520812 RepID=UPI0008F65A6F|nr:hypothetical protein [Butyrivibrio sp. YAB3001]SFC64984.1 hypothetical protein SAMN02910398_02775 [Butyrivibrio sp. YAB3001]